MSEGNIAKMIAAGVRNLHSYGYPHCTAENIFTDEVYSAFFKSMLESNKGQGFDDEIKLIERRFKPEP